MCAHDEMSRSVLIIDDDFAFCESLADMLQPKGYAPITVGSSESAVAALRNASGGDPVAVALIDVRLNGAGSGVDLIPRLRAEQPDLICVLMTAGIDSQTAIAALRRGAYDYFDKACEPSSLFAVLDRCFDRVALLREREAAYEALRMAKEQAETANRGKSSFLAAMSHELRTPLNAIIGFSEMMMGEVLGGFDNPQYRSYVANIHESGTHLLQIINDILDLSKAEAGKLELHEEVFDLRATIRSVRQLISGRLSEGGLFDSVDVPDDLPLLRADERKTKQVLLNLVSNAVKFTPPGGRIDIVVRFDRQTGVTLMVSDTGIGIARDDIRRVLKPFEQVDSAMVRSHQGTGLGLPLVKAIVELHGGRLKLESQLGFGTRASVIYPAERAVVPAAEASRTAA